MRALELICFAVRSANFLRYDEYLVRMWPFGTNERVNDVRTTCDCKDKIASLQRDVMNVQLDMENLRNNVLRKIQKRRTSEPEEQQVRKGGIIKPSELQHGSD